MKISRSTRKILIISLVILLIILLIILYITSKQEKTNKMVTIHNNGIQSSGVTEEIENVFDNEEVIDEEVIDNEESATKVEETEEIVEELQIVYGNMTMDQLSEQLNKSLSSDLANKGYLYASYSLERGVDPYLAVAISLEETGCTWGCSSLVKYCNNVGGMKGSGCGAYGYFDTLDDGIRAFIDNIANNYVAYGLTTAELMNPKYAENPNWAANVNAYIEKIKNR